MHRRRLSISHQMLWEMAYDFILGSDPLAVKKMINRSHVQRAVSEWKWTRAVLPC